MGGLVVLVVGHDQGAGLRDASPEGLSPGVVGRHVQVHEAQGVSHIDTPGTQAPEGCPEGYGEYQGKK